MYQVRRVNIGKTAQIDELAHACGELYSQTVVFFWETVRHKGIWLTCAQTEKIFTSEKLHAHTSEATGRLAQVECHKGKRLFSSSLQRPC